jgi:hypothetical protein
LAICSSFCHPLLAHLFWPAGRRPAAEREICSGLPMYERRQVGAARPPVASYVDDHFVRSGEERVATASEVDPRLT